MDAAPAGSRCLPRGEQLHSSVPLWLSEAQSVFQPSLKELYLCLQCCKTTLYLRQALGLQVQISKLFTVEKVWEGPNGRSEGHIRCVGEVCEGSSLPSLGCVNHINTPTQTLPLWEQLSSGAHECFGMEMCALLVL